MFLSLTQDMKKDNEKENFIQKRKLTNATDPELKLRASVRGAPENSPNRKVRTLLRVLLFLHYF